MSACGQRHPMKQHDDLRCDREVGHSGAEDNHSAPLFPGSRDRLEWSRRPEDEKLSPEAKSGSLTAEGERDASKG